MALKAEMRISEDCAHIPYLEMAVEEREQVLGNGGLEDEPSTQTIKDARNMPAEYRVQAPLGLLRVEHAAEMEGKSDVVGARHSAPAGPTPQTEFSEGTEPPDRLGRGRGGHSPCAQCGAPAAAWSGARLRGRGEVCAPGDRAHDARHVRRPHHGTGDLLSAADAGAAAAAARCLGGALGGDLREAGAAPRGVAAAHPGRSRG